MLSEYDPFPASAAIQAGIADNSSLVRRAAARALSNADFRGRGLALAPLLLDPVRAVRLEAAETLAGVPPNILPAGAASELDSAIGEYIAAQKLNADRPEAHLNLGLLYARENHDNKAEAELKIALSLDPAFVPAAINLADLYRQVGNDTKGESVLRTAIARSPSDASLQHALGLLLIRQGHGKKALAHLAAAVRMDPTNARFKYVYAVALDEAGHRVEALETLKDALRNHPYDRETLAALVSIYREAGSPDEALPYANRLKQLGRANP
ncbi:MAG: tetratricopeptide repeat protein [Candidatus Binataceae bacterium]